jgi:hypothetical protein
LYDPSVSAGLGESVPWLVAGGGGGGGGGVNGVALGRAATALPDFDGSVSFTADGTEPLGGAVAVTDGVVTGDMSGVDAAINALPAGQHTITATFDPSAAGLELWVGSTSNPVTVTIGGDTPLSLSGASGTFAGVPVITQSMSPTVTESLPAGDEGGVVSFADSLGVFAAVPVSNGQAIATYPGDRQAPGTTDLTATYISANGQTATTSTSVSLAIESVRG